MKKILLTQSLFIKFVYLFIRLLSKNSGFTLPGHLLLKLCPEILSQESLVPRKGCILVSGTNGKTSTVKLVSHILRKNGHTVVSNSSGSNLLRGVVTSLFLDTDFLGHLRSDIAVLEVDEFALPLVLKYIDPHVVALLNLSRDQLDRYGEVDLIMERWLEELKSKENLTVVADYLQEGMFPLEVLKPVKPDSFNNNLSFIKGAYDNKNVNTAIKVCESLKIKRESSIEALEDYEVAFGRGEEIFSKNTLYKIYLAKNPDSFNNNLSFIKNGSCDYYWLALNDNIPDGRDVSWIFDIDTSLIKKSLGGKKLLFSGKRALDMSIRMKYAGLDESKFKIFKNHKNVVDFCDKEKIACVTCFPNYSAMLEIRKLLKGRGIL